MGLLSAIFSLLFIIPLIHEGVVDGFVTTTTTTVNTMKKRNSESASSSSSDVPLANSLDDHDEEKRQHQPQRRPESIFYKAARSATAVAAGAGVNSDSDFNYNSNPTVFGQILRGELETRFIQESDRLFVFEDHKPRAPFHGLVIPKHYIPSIFDTGSSSSSSSSSGAPLSLSLLEEMNDLGKSLVRERYPEAYKRNDYVLCFHIPPFNSVDHLHLHVLAPASSMNWLYRHGKYNVGSGSGSGSGSDNDVGGIFGDGDKENLILSNSNFNTNFNTNFNVRWCTSMRDVLIRLREGSPPTPYRKDDDWSTIFSDTMSSISAILSQSRK